MNLKFPNFCNIFKILSEFADVVTTPLGKQIPKWQCDANTDLTRWLLHEGSSSNQWLHSASSLGSGNFRRWITWSGRPRSALHLRGGGSRRRRRNTCVTITLTWQGLLEVTLLGYAGVGLSFKFRMREMQQRSDVPRREFEEHYLAAPWYSQLI